MRRFDSDPRLQLPPELASLGRRAHEWELRFTAFAIGAIDRDDSAKAASVRYPANRCPGGANTMKNIIIVVLALCTAIHAQPPRVYTLHNFNGTTEGKTPEGALITDQNGNLYGVTQTGGGKNATCYQNVNNGCGTVFELIAPAEPGAIWRPHTYN